jgi:hypothetical protein
LEKGRIIGEEIFEFETGCCALDDFVSWFFTERKKGAEE